MKYITRKESETGKKFMACYKKMEAAAELTKELAISLGAIQWRWPIWKIGGISSLIFDTVPDKKIWRNVNGQPNAWMPKLNTKEGRRINSLIEDLPQFSRYELNQCIGLDGWPTKLIGCDFGEGEYVGFSVDED